MIKKLLTVCIMTMLIGSSAMDVSASTLTYSERVDSDVSSEVGDICEEVSGNLKRNYAERYIVEDFETNIYRAEQSEDKFIVYLFSKFDGMMKEEKLEDCAYVKGVYSALGVECTEKGFEADIKEITRYSKSAAVEQVSDSLINEMEIYEKYISEYTDFNFFYRIEFDMNNDVIEKENYKVYLDDTDILFEEIMPKSEAELFQQGMERVETLNDTIVAEKTIDLNANAKSIRSNEQKYGMMVSYMTTYTSNPSGCDVCEECDMLQDRSYWNNSEYVYYGALLHNDCADYVSQAMCYAGIREDSGWYAEQGTSSRSETWVGVAKLTTHMVNRGVWSSVSASNATYGDIISYSSSSHVTMITYKDANGVIKYSGHTKDRLNCVTSLNSSNSYYRVNFDAPNA